ncbi:hypothetical protein AWC38_SpisGene4042 [Stylophora pistillata]|uniref:C2H2-type domain-containing protein n=1 Tax=Stylophora pistillata TaxID=50429 RepID=A0A2B4SPU9_STYPI|nr:hypothetical protein AWC38_SpisGene4042 [Stylophora pistillata]
MVRTGKTNAAKGVHNHYNEYKEFHSRELEAHICASFMTFCEKSSIDAGVNVLVNKTTELERRANEGFACRFQGCMATFTYHSRRVRHELEKHNLHLLPPFEGDEFGYYICRSNCGLCFKTKSTRNSRLAFGLLIMAFEDAVKEGDGQRLCDIYRVALLLYKLHNHYKYSYVVLLFLVNLNALLPKFEAERLKWNRFYNINGGKGCNISLELKKEHQNCLLKKMWLALGPNLDETNAARLAGTLDAVETIIRNVDSDCSLKKTSSYRSEAMKSEAVSQILDDLLQIKTFTYTPGREGHPSFPQKSSNLVKGLDFRDLHCWMKEHLKSWKTACTLE